MMTELFHTGCS